MAKQCTFCGEILPRDDAYFCNNCGKPVTSQSARPASQNESSQNQRPGKKALPPQQPFPPAGQQKDRAASSADPWWAIREQIAQQPPSRPPKRPLRDQPPAWMDQLESKVLNTKPAREIKDRITTSSTPPRQTTTGDSKKASADQEEVPSPALSTIEHPQKKLPEEEPSKDDGETEPSTREEIQPPKPATYAPQRELHVKVWEREQPLDLQPADHPLPEQHKSPAEETHEEEKVEDESEDLPTGPLMVADTPASPSMQAQSPSHPPVQHLSDEEIAEELPTMPLVATSPQTALVQPPTPQPVALNDRLSLFDEEVEELDTRPLQSQRQAETTPSAVEQLADQQTRTYRVTTEPGNSPVMQRPITPVLATQAQSQKQHAPELRQTPPISMAVPPLARPRRKSRKRLVLVSILLFILVVAGLITWVIVFQPFTVPEITKPEQSFRNIALGVSLQYPQGWQSRIDTKNSTISLFDDNHTDQVNISATAMNGQTIDQYINKQVAALGMTGQKLGATLSFAGTSWRQVYGNVQQSGASYTASLLVTTHGDRYYAIIQLAPSSTYTQEDQLVFSNIRSSFQFI